MHRSTPLLCVVALMPVGTHAGTIVTSTFQGITHYERTETVPRQLVIHVVEIDLSAPGLSFFTTPGNGSLPGETTGQTTSQFVEQYGLQIGINTGFFSSAGTGTNPDGSLAIYRNLSHIAVSNGVGVSPWSGSGNSREAAMNITQGNVATVVRPTPPASATTARGRPTCRCTPRWAAMNGCSMAVSSSPTTTCCTRARPSA